MAREINRLSPQGVKTTTTPGLHADGNGLYLRVDANGNKRWCFLYRRQGKRKEMGLGPLTQVSLKVAREMAADALAVVKDGRDPVDTRRQSREVQEIPTFGKLADDYLQTHLASFRNEKHKAQWEMTLGETYCRRLRKIRVDQVTVQDVLATLKPIWTVKPETASRLRGRIEKVLDAASAALHRSGDNPARWKGRLEFHLGKPKKLSRGHHRAMPYSEVPKFVARLQASEGTGALALEYLTHTVSRTGEVIGMTWSELDFASEVWTVPAERMKAGRAHRVPLTSRAVEILRILHETRTGDYVFPGLKRGKPISSGTMTKALRTAKGVGTVHGLRSAFRDWLSEETAFDDRIGEAALAHTVGDATERAYRRGDVLQKRRQVMLAWSNYVTGNSSGKVVHLGSRNG